MSSYKILNPQLKNSKKLNVKIKTSTNPKKNWIYLLKLKRLLVSAM